jgi:hypothetical protein
MAGLGAKLFASFSKLTAAQVNGYLMDQSIMRFANVAARDAAFGGAGEPTLAEGMTCYLDDTNVLQTYTGSAWVEIACTDGKAPRGVMGYFVSTANSAISTTTADITGTSITFTAVANRLYRATFSGDYSQNTANAVAGFYLTDGSNNIIDNVANSISVANGFSSINLTFLFTATAGSTTRKMRTDLSSGTGSIRGTGGGVFYSFIIEDLGSV